jgi:hypothetical protein
MAMYCELILETEFASLWFYPDPRIVHHQFHKPIFGQAFQEVLLTGLELFQDGKADKWLSDDRANTILPPDDSAWSSEYWLPAILRAGWTHWAIVLPERRLGQINMHRLMEEVRARHVLSRTFTTPSAALAWLEQQG